MYQKTIVIGRLGKDPEIRNLNNGIAVCNFSLAVTKKIKEREETEWFSCVCWQRLAEIANNFLKKGSLVFCEGELKTTKYKNKNGQEVSSTVLNVMNLRMLATSGKPQENKQATPPQNQQQTQSQETQYDFYGSDELPF